ncbi:hypothetical protein [Cylindrospermum sp. FACHB-282]|uniref:hypothetical protein n=1 Tax=Cylindrospermum sp. FACHB-282 TaxID=2692794 RepID=UPI001682D83A|nr:hypothetical protein [Cylindrospermum sp. FACHB-282]MBD2385673.1 hypothetical protein [Cylindrospermum sp. FACHB-282]
MAENPTSNNPELFRDLSEEEQEILVAGEASLFYQQTNIQTTAENTLNLGGGDVSSQKSTYNLSQTTISYSIKLNLPTSSPSANRRKNVLGNFLISLFS